MRAVFFLALLCATCLVGAQTSINYTTKAIPLEKVVAELAKQSGEKLLVSEQLSAEPVAVRLKGATPKEVEDRLANVFCAEWVPTKQGLELQQTPKTTDALEKQLTVDRLAAIRDSINKLAPIANSAPMNADEAQKDALAYKKLTDDAAKSSNPDEGHGARAVLANRTDDMRLLAQMITAIGAEKIAALPYGYHVFSLDPTATELPIEGIAADRIDEYLQQRNMLAAALENAHIDRGEWDEIGDTVMFYATQKAKGPVRPLLSVYCDPNRDFINAALSVYDSNGERLSLNSLEVGAVNNEDQFFGNYRRITEKQKTLPNVHLPKEVAELCKRQSRAPVSAITPLTENAIDLLAHPEEHDPLSIGFSDMLIGTAQNENRNLIASVADGEYVLPRWSSDDMPSEMYELFLGRNHAKIDRPDGWLIVSSRNPEFAAQARLDRSALGKFSRAQISKGDPSIDDWADVAASMHPLASEKLPLLYWGLLRGDMNSAHANSFEALRLYGLLSDSQRSALAGGQSLSYHTLSPEEQDVLNRLLYNESGLRKLTGIDQASYMLNGLADVATESVPNGISPNATLRAKVDEHGQLLVKYGYANSEFPTDEDNLAMSLVQVTDASNPVSAPVVDSVRYIGQRTITFDLDLGDNLAVEAQLTEDHTAGTDLIPVAQLADKLPPDVWARIDRKMKEIRLRQVKTPTTPVENPPPTAPPF